MPHTLSLLDDACSKNKDSLDTLFKVATIQREKMIKVVVRGVNFRKSIWWKFCLIFSKKYQVPFTWNYFATSDGKGAIDGIGGEAKSIVRQQDLSKMKNVIAQNASDFAEVCKANLHRVTTHLITK